MKSAVYTGDQTFLIEERVVSEPSQDEVRLKIAFAASVEQICTYITA